MFYHLFWGCTVDFYPFGIHKFNVGQDRVNAGNLTIGQWQRVQKYSAPASDVLLTNACREALEELPAAIIPNATELDRLFIIALNLKLSLEQKLAKLFGPVTATSNPTEVYVDGSCLNNGKENATAGAGIFWGPNHTWNEDTTEVRRVGSATILRRQKSPTTQFWLEASGVCLGKFGKTKYRAFN
ncbi:hypothetical protein DFH08DRAFT_819897 [Mycena albidolilacea]|uniref:Uncharacterized protein n=1 Tax=Mycena albidolilacea TaxID=1033008 RepID=A0AAD6ZDP1_9AGAR|nr:hypothetical protein DFH08DRAFT_819897 [Mycena albidolilacea]